MNVFILCTGRCGSTTFIEACKHISNYSAGHETRSHLLGDDRFAFPSNHIEADNRFSWLLGRLNHHFGEDAFYVHLTRDLEATAASFVNRYERGIIRAYREAIIMGLPPGNDPREVCLDYCNTVHRNIESFLKDKPRKMSFRIEDAREDFPRFCEFVGAELDMSVALAEFDHRHNASKPSPR